MSIEGVFTEIASRDCRPNGDKEGVLVAWGYTMDGERVLLSVRLGQWESHLDWLDLGRDLAKRGLVAPRLVISDGAPVGGGVSPGVGRRPPDRTGRCRTG
jgi:hypothetical protein